MGIYYLLQNTVLLNTVYDRIFGDSPAKSTVYIRFWPTLDTRSYTASIYGSGQPYVQGTTF